MSIENATFVVQRGADQFSCQGKDLEDKLENGDMMILQRGADKRSWVVKKAMPWDDPVNGVWHVEALETIRLTGGPFTAWDVDGKNERQITSISAGEEVVFVTSSDCSRLFQQTTTQHSNGFEFKNLTDTSKVTNMSYMFYQAKYFGKLKKDVGLKYLDTSAVTNMSAMFYQATEFDNDLSSFDVSNVTDMTDMFNSAEKLSYSLNGWDVSNVTSFEAMFYDSKYAQDISEWDTSGATNMDYMFDKNSYFQQDLSEWCVRRLSRPRSFTSNSGWSSAQQPQWGTCPRGEDS